MKELLFIAFGWLLGLLGAPIVTRIEKHYKREDFKKAIFSELKYLAIRLSSTCYKIQMHLGIRDKATLEWVKKVYEKYEEDCPKGVLEGINRLLESSDAMLNAATQFFKANESECLGLKAFSVPYTDSILESLSVFNSNFQKNIFDIRDNINILNEETESAMFHYRLTFDPKCMDANKEIIQNNIRSNYNEVQRRCRIIVDKIENLIGQ